jgi:RNA recognition motif-containing protein
MSQARLFVGNLSYETGESDLQDHFAQAGAILSVNLMLDKLSGRSRGFAFVEFSTPEEAQKAIELFHGQEFQGRKLSVNVARPREERPPREDRPPRERYSGNADRGPRERYGNREDRPSRDRY